MRNIKVSETRLLTHARKKSVKYNFVDIRLIELFRRRHSTPFFHSPGATEGTVDGWIGWRCSKARSKDGCKSLEKKSASQRVTTSHPHNENNPVLHIEKNVISLTSNEWFHSGRGH